MIILLWVDCFVFWFTKWPSLIWRFSVVCRLAFFQSPVMITYLLYFSCFVVVVVCLVFFVMGFICLDDGLILVGSFIFVCVLFGFVLLSLAK